MYSEQQGIWKQELIVSDHLYYPCIILKNKLLAWKNDSSCYNLIMFSLLFSGHSVLKCSGGGKMNPIIPLIILSRNERRKSGNPDGLLIRVVLI